MGNSKTTTIRLDDEDRKQAYQIFEPLGLNASQVFNMFIK